MAILSNILTPSGLSTKTGADVLTNKSLVINHDAQTTVYGSNIPLLQLHGKTSFAQGSALLANWQNGTGYSELTFQKSRGSISSPTSLIAGDRIGEIAFLGRAGTAFDYSAYINAQAVGTPTSTDVPSEVVMGNTKTGAASPSWRLWLTADGSVRTSEWFRAGGALQETRSVIGASDINLLLGNIFTRTISGATTLTVSNVPASGVVVSFILDLTNGGSAAITWWAGMKWAGGTVPTLTAAGRDVLGFFTHDGGTTWTGLLLGKDVK
jgi:hypothetical protein